MTAKEALQIVKNKLPQARYFHSLNVAEKAGVMALRLGIDSDKAYLIGILHDCAKGLTDRELLALAEANGLIEDPVERWQPDLLHAPVGAFLLAREHGVKDEEILNAVKRHTLGEVNMTTMDKIIFLADVIEPTRKFAGVEDIRFLAERDLDSAMVVAIDMTLRYCIERSRFIHPKTVRVRNQLLRDLRSKGICPYDFLMPRG